MAKSDFPAELTRNGRRSGKRVDTIIKNFPEFWKLVLNNTASHLSDKDRYELFWFDSYDFLKCNHDLCEVSVHPLREFCSNKCKIDSGKVRGRIVQTTLERYGSISSLGNKAVREKGKQTNLERHGMENGGWSKQAQDKIKATCQERYGTDSPGASEEIRDKMQTTILEKYGSITPFGNKEIQQKIKNKIFAKYGTENILALEKYRNKEKNKKTKSSKFDDSVFEDSELIDKLMTDNGWKSVAKAAGYSQESHSATYRKLKLYGYDSSLWNEGVSVPEKEIKAFIEILGFKPKLNTRKVIKGVELDIFVEEKNFAIEFDGIYWHSSNNKESDKYQSARHLKKTNLCDESNINLVHIFENEWYDKKDIWKSVIRNKLGKSKRLYARKCEIRDVDVKIANDFCKINHLQGSTPCSFAKGLYYNDDLVMVATFGKSRYRKDDVLELIRMCSVLDHVIVGGASKLFNTISVPFISYANRRWSSGNVYNILNGKLENISGPSYWYIKSGVLYHRSTYMKHKLKHRLEKFDPTLTEVENCYNDGLRRIWDCGQLVYLFNTEK